MEVTSDRFFLAPNYPDTAGRRVIRINRSTKFGTAEFFLTDQTVAVEQGTVGAHVPLFYTQKSKGVFVADLRLTVKMATSGMIPFCTGVTKKGATTGLLGCILSKLVGPPPPLSLYSPPLPFL